MLESAIMCLALTVFHEARGEPVPGQVAVAQVILNRANGDLSKVCDVVKEPGQFTNLDLKKKVKENLDEITTVMYDVVNGVYPDYAKGAKYFKHKDLAGWENKFIVRIGNHNFYR